MNLQPGLPGVRGFDTNTVVSAADARALGDAGYRFAIRYVPRVVAAATDLSAAEMNTLFLAGLAVMPVQHVESESSWTPTDDKGRQYGDTAAATAAELGLPPGATVWLDLEGVAQGADPEQIVRYGNYWFDRVAAAGFEPGLYVGWHCGLTPAELYQRLRFTKYWAAYNLNADEYPATCGICMKQREAKVRDVPPAVRFAIDVDVMIGDAFGRFPMLTAPDEWIAT